MRLVDKCPEHDDWFFADLLEEDCEPDEQKGKEEDENSD